VAAFGWTDEWEGAIRRLSLDNAVACTEALVQRAPSLGATIFQISEGYATYHGNSPMSFASGLGIGSRDHSFELDAVEKFYFSRDMPTTIWVNDYTDQEFVRLLECRGYTRMSEVQTLILPMRTFVDLEVNPKIRVTPVGAADADEWIRVVATGYGVSGASLAGVPQSVADNFYSFGFGRGTTAYLAYEGETPIAGAALTSGFGLAILRTASTLPEHRGKGAQTALISARLRRSRELGCAFVFSNTDSKETPSARHLMRFGFRPLRKPQIYQKGPSR